jgi:phytoene dehydrogenase-like protein
MEQQQYDAIIIGAGLAGLTAALHLEKYNLRPLIIDKDERVGGRIKTDEIDGFLLDRGFQVILEDYPILQEYLNLKDLYLQSFEPGAILFNDTEKFKVRDVRRKPFSALAMAFSPVGTFMDKVRLGNMVTELQKQDVASLFTKPETTTLDYLQKRGFSKKIIERFFKPFFAGIYLENNLQTSSRMFEFVFKLFSEGNTCVPARGMEEIPKQLKAKLKQTEFMFQTEVKAVEANKITLSDGQILNSEQIVVSTPGLLTQERSDLNWQSTSNFYFETDASVLNQALIALNFKQDALVNNFTVLTDTSKLYAPKGKHLVSVSLTSTPKESVEETSRKIKNELALSFGSDVQNWRYLHHYNVDKALPVLSDLQHKMPFEETRIAEGLYLAGDYLLNASINGAMQSGESAAKALILNFKGNPHA